MRPESIIVEVAHQSGTPIVGPARNDEPLFLSVQCDISFMMALVSKTIGFVVDPLPDQGNAAPPL
ncbi:hypothetical protein D3C75_1356800 [compost metagenome]